MLSDPIPSSLLLALAEQGWVHWPQAWSMDAARALARELEHRLAAGSFAAAGIGQGQARRAEQSIRGDRIHWLQPNDPDPFVNAWFKDMRRLAQAMNQNFFLGINAYEAHFACYEPGAFYQKHLDRFRGDAGRRLSTVLFLNESWQPAEGGELVIYDPTDAEKIAVTLMPELGSLVIFESDRILHEVLTTRRRRISLTGWMKTLPNHEAIWQGALWNESLPL